MSKTSVKKTLWGNLSPFRKDGTASELPMRLAYCYLAIPMYIFAFGWMKLPFALIMAAALTAGLYYAFQSAPKMDISVICKRDLPKMIVIVLLALVWVYMSGIGGFAYQNYDHMWRNAVLETLVVQEWPVIITDTKEYFDDPVAMIYYFALWLPAACVGKLWGMTAAHGFLYIWCVIGVLLVFALITGLSGKFSPWIVIAFLFFSGLDAVGDFILHNSSGFIWLTGGHLENWAHGFQMSSVSTQLFWVFNQAIPAWLITLMILHQKDNKSLLFIYSFSFMFCTLPAIGLIPIVACAGIGRIVQMYDKSLKLKQNLKPVLFDAFTFQNITAGGFNILVSYLFLKSNSTGNSGFRTADMKNLLMSYLIFVFLEFLVYYLAVYKYQRKNKFYYVSLVTLLLVPMIVFGPHVDFVMRASIPALVVLFVLLMDTIIKCRENNDKIRVYVIIVLLVFGGITAYHEMVRSISTTITASYDTNVSITAAEIDLFEDGKRDNFFGEYEDSVFFNYIAKD